MNIIWLIVMVGRSCIEHILLKFSLKRFRGVTIGVILILKNAVGVGRSISHGHLFESHRCLIKSLNAVWKWPRTIQESWI